jgi:methylmalonyl-CoA decarboxylase subunit alpha
MDNGDTGQCDGRVPLRPPGPTGDLADPAVQPALNLVVPLAVDAALVLEELHDGSCRGLDDGSGRRLGTLLRPDHDGHRPGRNAWRIAILRHPLILSQARSPGGGGYIRRVSDEQERHDPTAAEQRDPTAAEQRDPTAAEQRDPTAAEQRERIGAGGAAKYHQANAAKGKMFARDRVRALVDAGSFVEDGAFANALAADLPADGVVTGTATIDGRPIALLANDSTVKAGSWGARSVEKMLRIAEFAYNVGIPMVYLVDSAGARITDQVAMFPGRRGAGHLFHTQVRASGSIPQVCALFGPSAAGGAYVPAFCDIVIMVEGNASMYLGSDRMVEMVTGEKTTLEAMGGARMHCTESGVGHVLVQSENEALACVRRYLSFLPSNWQGEPPSIPARDAEPVDLRALVPASERVAFDMRRFIRGIVDTGSLFEIHELWAREVVVGLARLGGKPVGIVANNSLHKGGVLFVDSADKAARFIQLCDAFNVPLIFLADVPGFMVGTAVEKAGIIRHGAKMVSAVSEATVPKFCVVVRKAYGAGLYAMAGPGFEPDATLALPTAKIAVMGADAAVNAVHANRLAAIADDEERAAVVAGLRAEYEADIDIMRLAAELVVDDIVEPEDLRANLIRRLAAASTKQRVFSRRRHGITPV